MSQSGTPPPPEWRSGHPFKMPEWVEPVMIVTILFGAMWATRRRNYSIFGNYSGSTSSYFYERINASSSASSPAGPRSPRDSTDYSDDEATLLAAAGAATASSSRASRNVHPPKTRRLFGIWTVRTPNSSRFANHWHSRVLQKFPFLIEMFYWVITLLFYKSTAALAQFWYGSVQGLWDVGQRHGIAILELEAVLTGYGAVTGTARWMEWRLQQWFLTGADAGDWRGIWLTLLNRSYAIIHIPGTVGFIAYYYWAAPTFARFSTVRRMMSLVNSFSFVVFVTYPTAPPRFLPPEYGFVDTVNAEDAQSVWMKGAYVNKLAAMPSLHFAYAFSIGCTFIVESGVLASLGRRATALLMGHDQDDVELAKSAAQNEAAAAADADPSVPTTTEKSVYRRGPALRMFLFAFGLWYPSWILLAIMATANHYLLDAVVGAMAVLGAFLINRVLLNLLPLEDWLLWALRLEKPVPTVGWVKRDRGRTIR